MHEERVVVERGAVRSMQRNLIRGEDAILASYGLIGAIELLGGVGFLADQYLGAAPWGLLTGLLCGLGVGFALLARVVLRARRCHT
jgi:F0F1-type ATP synthase assembly protein I